VTTFWIVPAEGTSVSALATTYVPHPVVQGAEVQSGSWAASERVTVPPGRTEGEAEVNESTTGGAARAAGETRSSAAVAKRHAGSRVTVVLAGNSPGGTPGAGGIPRTAMVNLTPGSWSNRSAEAGSFRPRREPISRLISWIWAEQPNLEGSNDLCGYFTWQAVQSADAGAVIEVIER
jgi:hypothetical protein